LLYLSKFKAFTVYMVFGIILSGIWSNNIFGDAAYAQLSNTVIPDVDITSPAPSQQVPVGELTISGTSADNATTNCQVDVDLNNQKPYQKTLATGPGGVNDYSNWTFTYTKDYHLITNGTNELTAKLSCTDNSIPVAWDSVDVLGTSINTSTANVGCISNDDQIGISKLVNATNITNATTNIATNVTLPSLVYNFEQSPNLSGSDCIDIANNSSLQLTMFSIASWFNTQMNVSNESYAFIVTKGGMGSDNVGKNMNYGIWMIDSENIETGFESSSGANHFVMSPSNYSDGNWHYAVGTYDGSAVKLYVDGVQVASNLTTTSTPGNLTTTSTPGNLTTTSTPGNLTTTSTPGNLTTTSTPGNLTTTSTPGTIPDNTGIQPVRIGANSLRGVDGKGDGHFIGSIGEIRVWNRTLSAEEVSAAYNNGLFNTTGQVLYLPFSFSFSSQNHRPVADAGPDLTVNENQVILLNNSKGSDPDPEDTIIYKWTQIGGSPFVRLSNNNTATPVFNAPLDTLADTTFTLQFSVTDNHGLNDTDTMNVLVKNISPPLPQMIPSVPTTSPLPLQPAIKDDEEKEQTEEEPEPEPESEPEPEPESEPEPEPESEPQPTTSLTEDDKTEEDTDEEENPNEQGKEVEEIQEEEEVQEQLQQILEKAGKVEEEVQQEVGKIEEDILEEVENGLR
jgi:Concanavalin A-like lectin/glucanases superfamily